MPSLYWWPIKKTVFSHFCGGETIQEAYAKAKQLEQRKIGTILDYAVEGFSPGQRSNPPDLAHVHHQLKEAINCASRLQASFVAVKMSAIFPREHLIALSANTPDPLFRNVLMEPFKSEEHVKPAWDRLLDLCNLATQRGVCLMIDAEDSGIQDAIDMIAMYLMHSYNCESATTIMNTYQMYRKDGPSKLRAHLENATRWGLHFGYKLVRGAYLEFEHRNGRRDILCATKQMVDDQYDEAVNRHFRQIVTDFDGRGRQTKLILATHNMESLKLAAKLTPTTPAPKSVYFAQLFGMHDHVTHALSRSGFQALKYLPYGPIELVIPYLIRRAQENAWIHSSTSSESALIRRELKRRMGF
jgi:proline dehydrogenase